VQHRLLAEEKARKHEQERSVGLAEKLADKDREVAELQAQLAAARAEPARTRKSQRMVALESRLHQLSTRLREAEMDKDQLGIKLSEKDEENRLKGRKISELLFRVQVAPPAESRGRESSRRVGGHGSADAAAARGRLARRTGAVCWTSSRTPRRSSRGAAARPHTPRVLLRCGREGVAALSNYL
jgi:hypothetical protein